MLQLHRDIRVRLAARQMALVAPGNEIVIAHGNAPRVLALQGAAYKEVEAYPLDVLGAQTEGMIGYLIEQELGNLLPFDVPFAAILTQVEVDPHDPAFQHPTKPIGPVYSKEEAERLAKERGWSIAPDGDRFRRVLASPRPNHSFEIRSIRWLLEHGTIVICAGGGGIPTCYDANHKPIGVEAVIDKDLCSALLAQELAAEMLIVATDVDAAYVDWGTPDSRAIAQAHPDDLEKLGFASGSMGPKVQAAIEFARLMGKEAVTGSLSDIQRDDPGTTGGPNGAVLFFESLGQQPEPVVVPADDLDSITSSVREHVKRQIHRVHAHRLLNDDRQAVHSVAEINRITVENDLQTFVEREHASLPSIWMITQSLQR